MDRALWLLLGLRFKGWLRRLNKMLSKVKGLLVTILGGFIIFGWLLSVMKLYYAEISALHPS